MSELPPKDKRTKAYKEWKAKYDAEAKGLGDTAEQVFEKTGIKKAVKFLAGEDCGCDKRKDMLNQIFPYQKPNCLTEEEFNFLADRVGKLNRVTPEEQQTILDIYNRVFNDSQQLTNCSSCFLNNVWKKLERIYQEYL